MRRYSVPALNPLKIIAAFCVLSFAFAPKAQAGDGAGKVNQFYGSFGTEVPIAVPEFQGIAPSIKLSYASGAFNGWAGQGWGVSGSSFIQRTSDKGGVPNYWSTDHYYLDGQELVTDTSMGGSHSTKIKNYTRIQRNTSGDTWYVWGTNGVRALYEPLITTSGGTYRYAMTEVKDTRGNTVNYNYSCDGSYDCYLDNISYNGTVVKFYRRYRSDHITAANGRGLTTTRYYLKTITVAVGGSLTRAYALSYYTATSGRMLLTSVTQYGRDATVGSDGEVWSGTSLPAMRFTWSQPPSSLKSNYYLGSRTYTQNSQWWVDLDGDGLTDYVYKKDGTRNYYAKISNGTSLGSDRYIGARTYSIGNESTQKWVDVNGDGMADLVYQKEGSYSYYVKLSNGYSLNGDAYWGAKTYASDVADQRWADMNGDGKTDLVYKKDGTRYYYVKLSTGSSFASDRYWGSRSYGHEHYTFKDMNGDGMADLVYQRDGTYEYRVLLSTGLQFRGETLWGSKLYGADKEDQVFTDMNGDGKTDLVYKKRDTKYYYVKLSTGSAFLSDAYWGSRTYSPEYVRFRDVNGDGLPDLVYQRDGTYEYRVKLNTGTTLKSETSWGTKTYAGAVDEQWWVDMNGDGKADLVYKKNGTKYMYSLASHGSMKELVTTLKNGMGGTTTVSYVPSTEWDNTMMASGMVLTTVASVTTTDGRGGSATTNYEYEGGLYSWDAQAFLGFRKATGVIDAAGNYTETYYHQHVGCINKPEVTYFKNAQGLIWRYTSMTYQENTTAPYTSLMTERWDYECNLSSSCRRVVAQISYDQYANATMTKEYGDYDVSGDERTTVRGYVPNTSQYIVALPSYESVYQGIGTGGQLMSKRLLYYDNNGSYTYAPQVGNLTRKRYWNSQTGGYIDGWFTYDSYGNMVSQTGANGKTITKVYDSAYHQHVVSMTDPLGRRDTFQYDTVLGLRTRTTGEDGGVVSVTYDALGRKLRQDNADGGCQTYAYSYTGSAYSQKIRVGRCGGSTSIWEDHYMDGLGRVYKQVDHAGMKIEKVYSAAGRVWKATPAYNPATETAQWTVKEYDGMGRVTVITTPDGKRSTVSYGNGYSVATNPAGNDRATWSDAYGQVTQIRERLNGSVKYTTFSYNTLGKRTKVVDAMGNVTTYAYDSMGRLLWTDHPDKGLWTYQYDNAGNITRQVDAKGTVTTFTYDTLGRVTQKIAGGVKSTFIYDQSGHGYSTGRLTTVTKGATTSSFTYDIAGRQISTTHTIDGNSYTVGAGYDVLGRRTRVTYPDNEVVTYSYGSRGQLTGVSGIVSAASYNGSGKLTQAVFANGTVQSYDYSAQRGWLDRVRVTNGIPSGGYGDDDGPSLMDISYGRNSVGLVSSSRSTTHTMANWRYSYDTLGRLTTATATMDSQHSRSYSYNAIGNMTYNSEVGGLSYPAAGQARPHAATYAGGQSLTYDANGNLVNGRGRTISYDASNRPVSVAFATGTETFTYDGMGGRVKKVGPGGTTVYVGKLVEIVNGQMVKYYYAGGQRVAKKVGSAKYWLHADGLGSVRLITNSVGSTVGTFDHDAYGALVDSSGSASDTHLFAGHEDDQSGLINMNARLYDPDLGRFVQADTVVPEVNNPQAYNPYTYVYNSPTNGVDPSGHAPIVAAVIAVAAAISAGSTLIIVVAVVGAACTIAGYALKNPLLSTIGGVLLGFASGGILGAAVSLATSPLSPLDPRLKQIIGWAYSAYGLIKSISNMVKLNKYKDLCGSGEDMTPLDTDTYNELDSGDRWRLIENKVTGEKILQIRGVRPGSQPIADLKDFKQTLNGEMTDTMTAIKDSLAKNKWSPDTVLGHSLGSAEALGLLEHGVIDANTKILAFGVPAGTMDRLAATNYNFGGLDVNLYVGKWDPVSLVGLNRGTVSALRGMGVNLTVVNTGGSGWSFLFGPVKGHLINLADGAHDSASFCSVNPALCGI